ncbi:hypothetical protein BOTBODRAFT_26718 [Botryobasidium botryosum FD-172 SS1]|uniref:GOLD domain-containing protein n=1 Tax=Botryobasidium botryosum (strain FD-172 SS1) TaxID=930990 RepID=A0A067N171_BOTB1|nr:hypothetical protein BOTBODRAFT_26718 [Botryobasidium botryosum FD-172 SS1]
MARLSFLQRLSWLFVPLFLAFYAAAHMVEIQPNRKECFFEDLHVNDKMTVTYQVGGEGPLHIHFYMTDPADIHLTNTLSEYTGTHSITAEKDGRYTYCFSNEAGAYLKQLSFNVHGVIYVEDDGTVAPIEREIRELSAALQSVKDEQEYIVVRERIHRNTVESTNDRVKWWSIVQAVMLFAVCGWQIYYLKSFFEVKRII